MKQLTALFLATLLLIGCKGGESQPTDTGTTETAGQPLIAGAEAPSGLEAMLADRIEGHDLAAYAEAIKDLDEDAATGLGLTALLNREPALAAWFYANDLASHPGDPNTQNQLGMLLHELYGIDGDRALLDEAITLLEESAGVETTRPEPANNLAYALLERYELDGDEEDLQTAIDMLVFALDLAPEEAIYHARLAQVQMAMGDDQTAMMSLAAAQRRDPINIVAFDVGAQASGSAAYTAIDRSYCDAIDYCSNCPKSIIGQINFVTCKMVEADAVAACKAGLPYAPSYDCSAELPTFGILIPGLNSGFSILTPFGSLDMVVDGGGNVKWQLQFKVPGGRIGPSFNVKGTWDPESGLVVTSLGPEVTIALHGRGKTKELMEAIEKHIGAVGVSIKSTKDLETGESGTTVGIKAVRGEVWSTH